MTAEWTI